MNEFVMNTNFCRFHIQLILLAAFTANGVETNFAPLALAGQTFIHDPSTIVKDGSNYFIFGTGPGIRTKSSPDLIHWQMGDSIFRTPPVWTKTVVPGFRGSMWAPDVVRVNGKFYLYYAVSTFGKQTSAIGLATNPTLDPDATNYLWTDSGPVISSSPAAAFNTIDPSALLDADGKLWLAFGSYWQGIFLTELDPQTGLRFSTNSPLFQLAWNNSIEAACLTRHENFYYLFVNWGQCCQGTNSTYEVRVGRAKKITGPYRDRDGGDLTTGGGSPFLASSGRFIGPGHIGIVDDGRTNGPTRFSYHYYDADTQGRSRLAIGKIDWSDGWPVAVNDAPETTNHWKLMWHDEFDTNGPPDPANWNYERGFVRNHELQWYQPENAYCTNGLLIIEARPEHKANPNYTTNRTDWRASRKWIECTSASLTTRRLQEFKYGRFEMRARIDTRLGSWPAFWTLGTTPRIGWPACGEVDIMEYYTGTVLANIDYGINGKSKWSTVKQPIVDLGGDAWSKEFHLWTMEWDEQKIDLRLDGKLMNHLDLAAADNADRGNPFHRPVYFILNQAIGGDSGGDPSHLAYPVRFEVDWVRVYQRAE
jgi:beta-glucanase (GH16 family)